MTAGGSNRRRSGDSPKLPVAVLPAPAALLARSLIAWYAGARRSLPWRGSRDPYAIWLAEVMLQQTQASVVAPYYARFLAAYPTVAALAQAPLSDVLARWSGLGYYARARSLHAAAQTLAATDFPRSFLGLRALPGFGPYTAAAVGSIAFGLSEPAIDGNAVRVYARLTGFSAPRAVAEPALREAARPLLEAENPSDVNQAIMDLGQLVCTATRPRCLLCPWQVHCVARRSGAVARLPLSAGPPRRRPLVVSAVLVRRRGRLLLARRRETGLFGGLWELPGIEGPPAALAAALRPWLGLALEVGLAPLAAISQLLTHRELALSAYPATAVGRLKIALDGPYLEARFAEPAELTELGLSSASRKLLRALALPAEAA